MAIAPPSPSPDETARVQQALRDAGLDVQVDGELGSQTLRAVSEFQTRSGLEPTGELDEAAMQALLRQSRASHRPIPDDQMTTDRPETTVTHDKRRLESDAEATPGDTNAQGTTTPQTTDRPRLHLVADQPVTAVAYDKLDFKSYAEAVAGIINNPETKTPLTIAISAPWGVGKSTLAALIQERLETTFSSSGGDTRTARRGEVLRMAVPSTGLF